ncbi:MAG: TlpA family protein disulfide reductase [Cryomorphaceae bacterium]|nr:MAG: TlpA family protein disulfide reductase [Cryomorphaceae bacterium]
MKNLWIIASLLFILAGCESSESGMAGISGQIENAAGEKIELNHIHNNAANLLEAAEIGPGGSFRFAEGPGMFDFYTVVVGDQQIVLLTDSTENVMITGDMEDLLGTYQVQGSKHSQILRDYYAGTQTFRTQLDSIQKAFQAIAMSGDEDAKQEMVDAFEDIREAYQRFQKEYVAKNTDSPACISILGEMNPEEHLELFKEVHKGIEPVFSSHIYYSMLGNQIAEAERKVSAMAKLSPGSEAPDIELADPNGKVIPLSSLRGKVVLIDFWASWCKPCRVENPKVVKMYNEMKDKGFEIYGVSLDRDKDKWVEAIQQDGLTWPQVSDLQFWNSAAAKLYNVSSIPHTVLIDRDGKIVASGLRGRALENKVEEMLAM